MNQKREKLWWFYWLPNMLKYIVWPTIEFVWHGFVYVRYAVYFITGFLSAPAIRLVWNWACPSSPIGAPQAMAAVFAALGLAIFLTKTQPGNDLLGALAALAIIAGCFCWLLLAALPALVLYAYGRLRQAGSPGKTAYAFYLGPIEWADRRFFLSHRTGN